MVRSSISIAANGSRLCEAVDFEKTNVQFKTKDKMKTESTELAQNPPFCKTDVSGSFLLEIAEKYLSENNIVKPHLQCERVSQGLSLRLKEMGIENRIRVAEIDISKYDGKLNYDTLEHHFIMVGRKVLDATAGQFKGMSKVYYGSLPMWYNCH